MADAPALGEIVKSISAEAKRLANGELALAKAELEPAAKEAGKGAGMFGGAGYFAINGMTLLYVAAALGLAALGIHIALAFVIVAAVLLLVAGILALIGRNAVKKVRPPHRTIAQAKAAVDDIKAAIARATAAAKRPEVETPTPRRQLR